VGPRTGFAGRAELGRTGQDRAPNGAPSGVKSCLPSGKCREARAQVAWQLQVREKRGTGLIAPTLGRMLVAPFEGGRVATPQSTLDFARKLQRRKNIFNALAAGLLVASGIAFFAAPVVGLSTLGARISLIFCVFTLVMGLVCVWDALLIRHDKPTFDVTLPPPISGLLGGVAAIAAGALIGKTIFS
jgi:hypothetical protein